MDQVFTKCYWTKERIIKALTLHVTDFPKDYISCSDCPILKYHLEKIDYADYNYDEGWDE